MKTIIILVHIYIPGIVKWGKITLLLGIFAGFLPALVIWPFRGNMLPVRHYRRHPDADPA